MVIVISAQVTNFLYKLRNLNLMDQKTAEAFILNFAKKHFSYTFPLEVLAFVNTKEDSDVEEQVFEADLLTELDKNIYSVSLERCN